MRILPISSQNPPEIMFFLRKPQMYARLLVGLLLLILGFAPPAHAQARITPIPAIQSQLSRGDDSALVGSTLTIQGIVTGVYGDLFFVQEEAGGPWSGIAIYRPAHKLIPGDKVEITGKVSEYYDLTQITPGAITILERNQPLPEPVLLTAREAANEAWEGVLLQLRDLRVVAPPNQYGEWRVADQSGEILVDDRGVFYAATPGESIESITAIVDHAFGSYRLIPRSLGDIGGAATTSAPDDLTPIYEIQGEGAESPLAGERVNTVGIVTAVGLAGFYLQDPVGDDNPLTSDGIYVYTHNPPEVAVGECLLVRRGLVTEFYEKTELSRVQSMQPVDLCPEQPVEPVEIPTPLLHTAPETILEPFEGMLVALPELQGIVQGPTKRFKNDEAELALIAERFLPYLPGRRVLQAEPGHTPALIFLSSGAGGELPDAVWGDRVTVEPAVEGEAVLAVLDYNFGKYQLILLPDQQVVVEPRAAVRDRMARPAGDDDFTLCTTNLLALGRGTEQFPEEEAYQQQLQKHSKVIAEGLNGCTIIGIQELGHPEDGDRLAEAIAEAYGISYTAVAIAGPGSQNPEFPLTLGLLARTDRAEIVHVEQIQGCSLNNYEIQAAPGLCPRGEYPLFNRPPLVVDLLVQGDWADPYPLTVIVNHWKSKVGDESVNVVRRTLQAEHVAQLVQERLDGDANANVVVLGDLNDFYRSGPVETLRQGTDPVLVHPYDHLPQLDRYTYIYNGASQVLDHILFTRGMRPAFAGIDILHINADFPTPLDVDLETLFRSSDHDPVQLVVRPAGAGWIGGNVGLPRVLVTLRSQAGNGVGVTLTDELGDFRFWGLPPGRYRIDFKSPTGVTIQAPEKLLEIRAGAGLFLQPPVHHRQATLGAGAALFSPGLGRVIETLKSMAPVD
jgi:uncharacterized protein